MLNLNYIEYSPNTQSLDIFCNGCSPPYCKNCCNPELIDFNVGKHWTEFKNNIINYIAKYPSLIKNIFLLGGSFNHQNETELQMFLSFISSFDCNIWLFCREELEDVKPIFRRYCDYVKTGAYIPELACEDNIKFGIKLATSNQNIYYVGDRY